MRKEDDRHDNDEGNRPSPIRPVHKLSTSDPLYEQQLLRDVAIVNERIRKELGSALHRAEATQPKRKPRLPDMSDSHAAGVTHLRVDAQERASDSSEVELAVAEAEDGDSSNLAN